MSGKIFHSEILNDLFESDGIVQVPFLSMEEVNSLISFYLRTSNSISERKFHSTMFINSAGYRKQIDTGIRELILERINAQVDNYRVLFCNFIVKEPSIETNVGIHQDWNFTSPEFTSINVWIPMVDITVHTGLFYALKGSHKSFKNIRYTPLENNAYANLEEFIRKNSASFEVKAGNALFYHGSLVHYSDPNTSTGLRIAVGAALIPQMAPNLHYYKRDAKSKMLEVYEVDDCFYHSFNFFEEPRGVKKIAELDDYESYPDLNSLLRL